MSVLLPWYVFLMSRGSLPQNVTQSFFFFSLFAKSSRWLDSYFGRQTHSVKLKSACLKSLHCRPRWRTVGLTEFCTAGHQTLTHSPPFADVVRLPASQAVTSARRKFKKKGKKRKKTGSDPSLCSAIGNKRWIIFLIMGIVTGVFPAVNSLVCSPECDLCFMCSGRNQGFFFFFFW